MPESPNDRLKGFDNMVLSSFSDKDRAAAADIIEEGTQTVIYGKQVQGYVDAALSTLYGGESESAAEIDMKSLATGVTLLAQAARLTEREYKQRRPKVLEKPEFRQAIEQLQADVSAGVINLLPEAFAMTPAEGIRQVEFADNRFTRAGQQVQLTMSGLNYATFTGKTMLNGERLLSADDAQDLTGWTERQMQESMPHLVLSNTAMGQIVSALLQKGKVDESFAILDTGSGTGCTLAGSVLGINDALTKNANTPRLSMTGIEGSRKFFDHELAPFADTATEKLSGISLEKNIQKKPGELTVESGQFNLLYGDILGTLKQLEFSKEVQNGVVVITANYVWHRLPTNIKDELIKEITQQAPNAIFLVADLVQNGSVVNRRYFNFRDNGLLNCGNIGLKETFEANDYRLIELNEKTAPASMTPELAKRIGQGTTSDSIFYIAYQGDRAAELVENW